MLTSPNATRAGYRAVRRNWSRLRHVLALRPRYLVLDEPTSQLDPLGTKLVGEALAKAARSTGVGVLIVEHKTDLLARMCDEICVVSGGSIVARGKPRDILESPR